MNNDNLKVWAGVAFIVCVVAAVLVGASAPDAPNGGRDQNQDAQLQQLQSQIDLLHSALELAEKHAQLACPCQSLGCPCQLQKDELRGEDLEHAKRNGVILPPPEPEKKPKPKGAASP